MARSPVLSDHAHGDTGESSGRVRAVLQDGGSAALMAARALMVLGTASHVGKSLVVECYHALAAAHEIIVIEGAGSPAEINLKAHDIVNMRMAATADAACLLVGDIDRGGVFASLLGTMVLLDRSERRRIRGFAINKFRGDEALLAPGIQMIERRMRRPCMGVIPHIHALGLDEEDSVALEDRRTAARA